MKVTEKMPPQWSDIRHCGLNGAQSYFCLGVGAFLCPHDFAIAFQGTDPLQPSLTALWGPPRRSISTILMKTVNQIESWKWSTH